MIRKDDIEPEERQKDRLEEFDDDNDEECSNCGGEGFYYSCDEEFACIDPEGGCDLCRRRCDWCRPPRKSAL